MLDPRTIDRLAELICNYGGPYERRVRDLLKLFEGAGWTVEYTDGARVQWIAETIRDRNDDPDAIRALLSRVIDPREYDGGLADAQVFVNPLNALLAADGLQVTHRGSRPVVRKVDEEGEPDLDEVAARLAGPQLRQAVRELVADKAMAEILVARLDEVDMARRTGAYLLAVIGTGSFIEGLLYDVLAPRDPQTRKADNVSLAMLLQRAHARGWIQHDAFSFGGLVREYRNFVHPRVQLKEGFTPDNDTVLLCWQPVLAVVNDLVVLLPRRRA